MPTSERKTVGGGGAGRWKWLGWRNSMSSELVESGFLNGIAKLMLP